LSFERDEMAQRVTIERGEVTFALNDYSLEVIEDIDVVGGVLRVAGRIHGDMNVASEETLAPGMSPGELILEGDFLLAGRLEMEISSSGYDRLISFGNVQLDGVIDVLLDFSPTDGTSFDLLDVNSLLGTPTFDFSAAPLTHGLRWDTSNFASTGVIRVVSLVPETSSGVLLVLSISLSTGRKIRRTRRPAS